MKTASLAILAALAACGGSEEPPAPAPRPAPPAPPPAPAVRLTERPDAIIRGYSPDRHPPEILCEAIRRTFASLNAEPDFYSADEAARLVIRLKDQPAGPAADQAMAEGAARALRTFSKPTPGFMAIENRLSRVATPKLCRVLIDEYLRVDRPSAERVLFEDSFRWIATPVGNPLEMYFSPNVLIPLARERDPVRVRKGMSAWLDSSAKVPMGQLSGGMLNAVDDSVMSILDEGATKEDYKRLAGHPFMIQAPYGFVFRWVASRRTKFAPDSEDLADILARQVEAFGPSFSFQVFEPVLGKSLRGSGDQIVRGLARILPQAGPLMARSGSGWVEYLGPCFQGLTTAEMTDLAGKLRSSPEGLSGLLVLCRNLVARQQGARTGLGRVFCVPLGPDAKQNEGWLGLFAYDLPNDAAEDLARALQRPEIPMASVERGVYAALNRKWKGPMAPVIQTAIRTRKDDLKNFLSMARSYYSAEEFDRMVREAKR